MAVWEEDASVFSGLRANFEPICLYHPKKPLEMFVFDTKLLNFKLHSDRPEEPWSFATDVVLQCPYCGYQDVYGVAISPKHHDRMWKKIEFLIVKNAFRRFWKTDPWLVVKAIWIWLKRRLTMHQPS